MTQRMLSRLRLSAAVPVLAAGLLAHTARAQTPAENPRGSAVVGVSSEALPESAVAPAPTQVEAPPPPAVLDAPPPLPAATPSPLTVTVSANPLDKDKPASKTDISGAPGQGLTVKLGDAFSMNIRSRLQGRYQVAIPQPNAQGERHLDQLVSIGTARLYVGGNVFVPELTYLFQFALAGRDYRDAGIASPIYDAYLDYKAARDFNVKVGQYFVPFDRLRTVREFALQLADRPRPVQELTLDRDVGITIYSEKFLGDSSPLAYRVGVFGGGGTNLSIGKIPGALVVGRLELRPFGAIDDDSEGDLERRPNPRLALGAAIAANINANRQRSTNGATFKTPTTSTYTGGTVDYTHVAVDLTFKWAGFALQAEYLLRDGDKDQVHSIDAADKYKTNIDWSRSGYGWVAQASYVLPTVDLEVVGRLSRLYAIHGTDPSYVAEVKTRGQEVAGGLNYYINGHRFKLQTDWIARMTPSFKKPEHLIHAQIDATF